MRITVRDLSKLGELLDAVVSAGANRMNGISFRIEESAKLLDQCRKNAMSRSEAKGGATGRRGGGGRRAAAQHQRTGCRGPAARDP